MEKILDVGNGELLLLKDPEVNITNQYETPKKQLAKALTTYTLIHP